MTALDLKQHYSRFLKGHEGKLHFAAHSHHFWPDVSREAHLQYWDDCALVSDEKWEKVFGQVIPKTQQHIAELLNLKHPEQIAFAPNTHELATRLLSLYLGKDKLRILTTTNEFHSWRRQFLRLSEIQVVQISTVSGENFLNDRRSFIENLKAELQTAPDLFFLSQVFFDSGLCFTDEELQELAAAKASHTIMVVDGYHGFAALPCNLGPLEGKIFYLGGGYKYAQAGEGVGFMVIPKGQWRPAYTGWFAEYAELKRPAGAQVGYADNFMAFMGATQDPSGLYRFNAVWDHFKHLGLSVSQIHAHVLGLQKAFLQGIPATFCEDWQLTEIFDKNLSWHGHFLTFNAADETAAEACQSALKQAGILIDRRGTRLRFGFGLYQNLADVQALCQRLLALKPLAQ